MPFSSVIIVPLIISESACTLKTLFITYITVITVNIISIKTKMLMIIKMMMIGTDAPLRGVKASTLLRLREGRWEFAIIIIIFIMPTRYHYYHHTF